MTRAELLAELREVLNDATGYENWSDTRLIALLSEGQDKFCEDTGYFSDVVNYTITLATDTAFYAIPDRAIQVMDIYNGTKKLGKILQDSFTTLAEWEFDFGNEETGMPNRWQTDLSTGYIKVYPTPTSSEDGEELTLHLWRYSRTELSDSGAEPELPGRLQRACVEWAAYKAFMNHDEELQDPIKAGEHLAGYKMYVTDGIRSLRRIQNMETRVGSDPSYRT